MVQIAVGSEPLWRRFAPLVGIDPQDRRFATNTDRVASRDELVALINEALGDEPAAYWLPLLDEAGIPAGRVRTLDEVYEWEQTRTQGLLIEVDHATVGPITLPGPPLRFDGGSPAEHRAPPTFGQHDAAIRRWLDEPAT